MCKCVKEPVSRREGKTFVRRALVLGGIYRGPLSGLTDNLTCTIVKLSQLIFNILDTVFLSHPLGGSKTQCPKY